MSKTLSDDDLRNTLLLDILYDTNVSGHHIEKIVSIIHKQAESGHEPYMGWHTTVIGELDYKMKEFSAILASNEPNELAAYYLEDAKKRKAQFEVWKAQLESQEGDKTNE
jgi:hypothetical protein